MANPVQDARYQAMQIPGTGYAATLYDDGSIVVWDISTGQGVAQGRAGQDILDLGNGMATAFSADGMPTEAWSIKAEDQPGYTAPGAPAGDGTPAGAGTGTSRAGQPGDDTASRVGKGRYQGTYGGQTVRKGDPGMEGIGFGSTVAPSTWNAASPGRSEGWGTIGAGTEGVQYGYGTSWNRPKESIKIDEGNLAHLNDPKVAPGYIPGSATYNQYDLSQPGLFQTLPNGPGGKDEVVNSRFGLGGTGDPTTGGERQTARRYITGIATDSGESLQGDDEWRRKYGSNTKPSWTGGGGLMGAVSPYMAGLPPAPAGGGGTGGGENSFFGSTVTSNWGQTDETRGLDFIATLFLRSDTPTGIGTPAASAPASMWAALGKEIAAGRVYVKNPMAWQMLAEKGMTPQSIGGQATGGQNVQPTGGSGAGAGGVPASGVSGTFKEGEETPFGVIKGGLPQGFAEIWHELLQKKAEAEGKQAVEEAKLSGQFNGLPTLAAKELEEKIKDNAAKNAIAKINADATMKQALTDEAFKQAQTVQNQARLEGDLQKMKDDIAVKREEIASIAATGDKDRAQRETESLREMETKMVELSGYLQNGQATLDREKFMADEQQKAYERAANPARAFENELARGNTGWNAPMQGPWGTTVGTPGADAALGAGAATQAQGMPSYNYGQPISFGFPGQVTGQPLPGTPEAQAAEAQAKQAAAAQYQATAAATGAQAQAAQTGEQVETTQAAAAPTGENPAEQQAQNQYAGNTTQPGAAGAGAAEGAAAAAAPATEQDMAMAAWQQYLQANPQAAQQYAAQTQVASTGAGGTAQPQGQQNPYPGYGPPAANYGYGSQGAAGLGQPDLNEVTVRTPAAVNAFKAGAAMPTAGQYGVASTSGAASTQAINERQVRTQNLKQSRRMSPLARQFVGSFARAGGVDDETQKMYGERAAPKSSQGAGSYSIK